MIITPSAKIVGASVEGTWHQKRRSGCQDAHAYRQVRDSVLVLASADGAGSARRAAEGAQIAVRSACDSIERALAEGVPSSEAGWKALLTGALQCIHTALEEMVDADQPPAGSDERQAKNEGRAGGLRDLATTLSLAVMAPGLVAAVQVGDGAIIGLAQDDTGRDIHSLTLPDHGEYINETSFVTGPDYLARAQYAYWAHAGLSGIALLTDGLSVLCLDDATGQAHAPFFDPLFAFVSQDTSGSTEEELIAFLQSPQVCERTDDDKTIVVAVMSPASKPEHQEDVETYVEREERDFLTEETR